MNCTDNTTYIPGQKKITPTGTIEITENGTYDVAQYANADVNVSGGGGGDDSFGKLVDKSIETAIIPNSVRIIGAYAFYGCAQLKSIDFPNILTGIGERAFQYCSSLTNIVIPSGVKGIQPYTFANCTMLESIDFPNSITNMDTYILAGCNNLRKVTVRATTPPTISRSTFDNTPSTFVIEVPAESVETYKNATYWSWVASRIQAIQE